MGLTPSERKEFAMAQATTRHSARASLGALGEYLRRHAFFAPLYQPVQIPQKTIQYRPVEKLRDALVGMLCGAKSIAQSNVTIRVDPAVQRAFGRKGCAEQSTIARTLQAGTPQTVEQLEQVAWYYLKRYGHTPRHRFRERLLWVDSDLTPLPAGAKAEGSERTWMGRCRSKTGRKVLRMTASDYREILHETLLRGKAPAGPALKAALQEVEGHLGWTREHRQRIVLRLDGGFGTTALLNWLLSRGYQVVATISNRSRVRTLRQQRGPWQPTSSPGRAMAEVLHPHRFCRKTRQWVIRTPQAKGGYQYAALVTTLPDLAPIAVAEAYDGRGLKPRSAKISKA
jgi:Transposase DDE domain group 1